MENKKVHFLLICLLVTAFLGCSKEETPTPAQPEPKLYFRCNFGNDPIEFLNYTEDLNNYYSYPNNPESNGFMLVMHERAYFDKTRYAQISITRISIDTLKTPWENDVIPHYPKPYVGLVLGDLSKPNTGIDANDSITYGGSTLTGSPIYIKINAIIGDTVEGTFHGDVTTKTGLLKHITNGAFRIKFKRFTQE